MVGRDITRSSTMECWLCDICLEIGYFPLCSSLEKTNIFSCHLNFQTSFAFRRKLWKLWIINCLLKWINVSDVNTASWCRSLSRQVLFVLLTEQLCACLLTTYIVTESRRTPVCYCNSFQVCHQWKTLLLFESSCGGKFFKSIFFKSNFQQNTFLYNIFALTIS